MRRGQSEVVAALLMTLILVLAFTLLWLYLYPRYLRTEQEVERSVLQARLQASEQLVLAQVSNWTSGLNLTVVNTGDVDVTLRAAYINETMAWSGHVLIPPGQATTITVSPPPKGALLLVKLCTTRGNCWTYPESFKTVTGTTTQPPPPPPPGSSRQPLFKVTSYNSTVYGLPGSTVRLVVTVANTGNAPGNVTLRVLDQSGSLKGSTTLYIANGSSSQASIQVTLPSTRGTYTWTIQALNQQTGNIDDTKTFTVYVFDLTLQSRTAFIYESFESTPSGWSNIGGTWTIVSGGWAGNALQGTDNNGGPGGDSVYYYKGTVPQSYQALVKLGGVSSNDKVYRGFALLQSASTTSSLYEVSIYPRGQNIILYIFLYYLSLWVPLTSSQTRYVSSWYTLYLSYSWSGSSNSITAVLYDASGNQLTSVTASDSTFQPQYLSLAVDEGSSLFDELVAATGDPRYVQVVGLKAGWTVELWQGGTLIASSQADSNGNAKLSVLQMPILRNVTLVVKDQQGTTILRKALDLVVGGDIYLFG